MKILLTLIISLSAFGFDHSHSGLSDILFKYTSIKNKQTSIDYSGIMKSKGLDKYLKTLEELKKSDFKKFSKNEKLAFWINTYNAYTIKLIINNYPVKSIKSIGGWFSSPWKIKFIKLFGKKISLDMIEHQIIRKKFDEPRIHFAVNCAAKSCPKIMNKAWTEGNIQRYLTKQTKAFLANSTHNKITADKLELSKIFDWYGKDHPWFPATHSDENDAAERCAAGCNTRQHFVGGGAFD